MRQDDWSMLRDMLIESAATTVARFGFQDATRRRIEDPGPWPRTVAMLGFAGHDLAGTLALAAPSPTLVTTHPLHSDDSDDLDDWLGELCNLVLGRLKAELIDHGIVVEIGVPMIVSGSELKFRNFRGAPFVYELWSGERWFRVLLDATASTTARLAPRDVRATVDRREVHLF